jgi:hypothetical protein
MIKTYLNQPYPLLGNKWKIIISISLFIPLFIMIFQPFGLTEYHGTDKIFIIAGYGLVTFGVLIINLFLVASLMKNWYNEKSWTVLRQLTWLIWIVFSIGLGNFLYSSIIFSFGSFYGFLIFQAYTLEVGIIPIVVLTIIQQNIMLSRNLRFAKDINSGLKTNEEIKDHKKICFVADNEKDKLEIELSDLLYIESSKNYIEVFHFNGDKLVTNLLRCSLKRIELQINRYSTLFKCHRSYIVNISKIIQVKGSSQGLKLVLKNADTEIPVSRNLTKVLREKIHSDTEFV